MNLTAVGVLWLMFSSSQNLAELAYEKSRTELAIGNFADAEISVREAISRSLYFSPKSELGKSRGKGLLFTEAILEARNDYRSRRARYFLGLGEVLALQKKWLGSRKAYSRATAIVPNPDALIEMADDPDLSTLQRRNLLLKAYLTLGADREQIEKMLLKTGIFRSRDSLKSSLDQKRFPELLGEFSDLEWLDETFPVFQTVTDLGILNTASLYEEGGVLVVYIPTEDCMSCSKQLDGLSRPVREAQGNEKPLEVVAFVPEVGLPGLRRIVRLLGMPIGVGRVEGLPLDVNLIDEGEIRVVARGGMTQIRFQMTPETQSRDIRKRVEAIFSFLETPGFPTDEKPELSNAPIVTFQHNHNQYKTALEWVRKIEKLEAGRASVNDLYDRLQRLTLRVIRNLLNREQVFDLVDSLGALRGANASKMQALGLLDHDIGDRLLAEAKKLVPDIQRSASRNEGFFFVDVVREDEQPIQLLLQRSFQTAFGLEHFSFVLENTGEDILIAWVGRESGEPRGVATASGDSIFWYSTEDDCNGLRIVRQLESIYDSCNALLIEGEVVEVYPAVVDFLPDPPMYYRRAVISKREESALEQGFDLYKKGDFRAAAIAFSSALHDVDEVAPYDATDVLYNKARMLELQGEGHDALELYRSLGDIEYQHLVDQGVARLERTIREPVDR